MTTCCFFGHQGAFDTIVLSVLAYIPQGKSEYDAETTQSLFSTIYYSFKIPAIELMAGHFDS